ncbi:advillin-like isoform X2 [Haliotis rufescens]|uniref:advillin-like isoform X2 n=1 Tax=Haliotis rufescens TaxID=6454 RepID=UPI00201E89C9|nr:advillin-like isoform X2 [Haliotis rufescens]
MRQKRSSSAPVRVLTHKRLTATPLTVTDYPRNQTTRASCRSRVSSRRLGSAMSGSGLGAAIDAFSEVSLDRSGLFIWKLEGRRLHLVEGNDHGFLLEGTAYIVLQISLDKTSSLHFWTGRNATENDVSNIHDLAHELDATICRASIFSKEVQGHESLCFLRLFPEGLVYLEGGPHTSLSRTARYVKRLYVVTGRKHVRAACERPTVSALDPSVSVILDGYPRVYVWIGSKCGYVTRVKAIQVARRIRNWQRKGKAHVVVIDEKDEELNKTFLKKLDEEREESPVHRETNGHTGIDHTDETITLRRVSGDRVLYDMPYAARKPLQYKYLVSSSCYLLDTGPDNPVFLWVGSHAPVSEVSNAISRGKTFSEHKEYPDNVTVSRVLEGHEPLVFRQAFNDWRDRPQSQTRKYSAGNMGRALFSRSSKRTVAKVSDTLSEDTVEENNVIFTDEQLEVYVLKENSLECVEKWDNGTFSNGQCYIINNQHLADRHCKRTLYYWTGCKTSASDRTRIVELAMVMEEAYSHNVALVRVLDGKEPSHMLNALGNSMIVFDTDLEEASPSVQVFSVREFIKGNIRVAQVPPTATSLNSSAAFVVISPDECFLWYGRRSGGPEREYAKYILGYLHPCKMYDYDIVTEAKETEVFWSVLGGRRQYEAEYITTRLERRNPRLFHCCVEVSGLSFDETIDFSQEDFTEQDLMLLDTFDQIFLWCGTNIDANTRNTFGDVAQAYLAKDQAGRDSRDLQLWYICQGHEPHGFTKYFRNWTSKGFGGKDVYDLARKRVRQENARIDVSSDILDKTHVVKAKYPYKMLVRGELPSDVDPTNKQHLTDKDFLEVIRVSRFQFCQLPKWKQKQILKMAHLTSGHMTPVSSPLTDKASIPCLSLHLQS